TNTMRQNEDALDWVFDAPRSVSAVGLGNVPNVMTMRYVLRAGVPIRFEADSAVITGNAPGGFDVDSVSVPQAKNIGLYVSAVGGASLGQPTGRRLPVHNLGSSGQDGVSVSCWSAYGGSVGVDLSPLLGGDPADAREIRIRPKGWDGTIKGYMKNTNAPGSPDICAMQFGGRVGMPGCSWTVTNLQGEVVRRGSSAAPTLDWSAQF